MRSNLTPRTIKRLVAAEGYLELNLPKNALEELEGIEDAGPLEAPRQFMMGQALKAQNRFEEAIRSLETAARRMPSPVRRIAWKALSECYRECGNDQLADLAETLAGPAVKNVNVVLPRVEISFPQREAVSEDAPEA